MATGYDVDQLLEQGRSRWLTNAELLFILENHDSKMIRESVPQLPARGSLFLYNKNITRSFRGDGHKWRKKPSGRVSESHELLKVHGVEVIECYYATREDSHNFKRRSYWMLDEAKKHIVLVHYRDTSEGKTNTALILKSSAGQSCTFTQSYTHESYQSLSNPCSEFHLSAVPEQPQMDHFDNLTTAGNLNTSWEAEKLPFQVFKEQQATLQQGYEQDCSRGHKECVPQEAKTFGTPECIEMVPIPMLPHPGQVQMLQLGRQPNLTVIPQNTFEIKSISPDYCFFNEFVVIGSFQCDSSEVARTMFDDIGYLRRIMQDSVIRCYASPNFPGKVTYCVTSKNLELCSEVKDFECHDKYIRLQQEENRNLEEVKLVAKFEQMLLSDPSLEKGESSFNSQERAYLTRCRTSSNILNGVLQELLKNKERCLFVRLLYGDRNLSCTLSENEKGIIHVVGGLGYEWLLEPILHSGVGVDFRDANGWTALHWAARFGRIQMVAALVANDASAVAMTYPTKEHPTGQTPASIADAYGHRGLAGYLCDLACFSFYTRGEAIPGHAKAQMHAYRISTNSASCGAQNSPLKKLRKLRSVWLTNLTSNTIPWKFLKNLKVLHTWVTDSTSDMASWVTSPVSRQIEVAKRTKVDEYGKTPGVSGAGLCECKRQKRDASPQGKDKLVDVSANEEELDLPLFSSDKDNVDPFLLLLQAPSPEYHEHWSLIEQNNYNVPL